LDAITIVRIVISARTGGKPISRAPRAGDFRRAATGLKKSVEIATIKLIEHQASQVALAMIAGWLV
jgi:hypothetical protein